MSSSYCYLPNFDKPSTLNIEVGLEKKKLEKRQIKNS